MNADDPLFPKFDYRLDESDPDVLVLERQDGTFVAAFSARGATREGIVEAAKVDYRGLIEAHVGLLNFREENKRPTERSA